MIKTIDRTPRYLSKESRDFQLLARLFDFAFNSSKTSIDAMINNQGTLLEDFRFVDLACRTVGFDYSNNYTAAELLYVAKSFKLMLKNKGKREAIEAAINLLLNSQGIRKQYYISEADWTDSSKELHIYLPEGTNNSSLLGELFNYILPAGWLYDIKFRDVNLLDLGSDSVVSMKTANTIRRKNQVRDIDTNATNYADSEGNLQNMTYVGQVPGTATNDMVAPVIGFETVISTVNQIEDSEGQ